jgi:hypothetical protein
MKNHTSIQYDETLIIPVPRETKKTIAARKGSTHRLEVRTGTKAGAVIIHE